MIVNSDITTMYLSICIFSPIATFSIQEAKIYLGCKWDITNSLLS